MDTLITITERIWDNPAELMKRIYPFLSKKVKHNEITLNTPFKYPELASTLHNNHYYLKEFKLTPDHFVLQPEETEKYGFLILMHLPSLQSENKYREIEIQSVDNYPYKKELFIRALERYSVKKVKFWTSKVTECERCHTPNTGSNLFVLFPNFDLKTVADDAVESHPKDDFLESFDFDFGESEDAHVHWTRPLVRQITDLINNAEKKIICKNCEKIIEDQLVWDGLMNPQTPEPQIREYLRDLVDEDSLLIPKLCELFNAQFKLPFSEQSENMQTLWNGMIYIARMIAKTDPGITQYMEWLPLLTAPNLRNSYIPLGLAYQYYRIDLPQFNSALYTYLFQSTHNLFAIFYTMNIFAPNSGLYEHFKTKFLDHLFNQPISTKPQSPDLKFIAMIQGVIYSKRMESFGIFLENLEIFPQSLQEFLLEECFRIRFEKAVEKLQSVIGQNKAKFSQKLRDIFDSYFQQYKAAIQEEKMHNQLQDELLQKDHEVVGPFFRKWKKMFHTSPAPLSKCGSSLIKKKYHPMIAQYVECYRQEFEQFFKTNPTSICALDVEEYHNRMFLVFAVEIRPDLSIFLKIIAADDIYPLNDFMKPLPSQIHKWLKSVKSPMIISHGSNEEEVRMITQTGHIQINTQEILHNARYYSPFYATEIRGEGLKHFEDFVTFERFGCPFLKHELPIDIFYEEAIFSMDAHYHRKAQRKCAICNKEQDVFLYCLEDAFSSLFIYVYFKNHEPRLFANGKNAQSNIGPMPYW